MFLNCPGAGIKLAWILAKVDKSLSWVDVHRALLSCAPRVMMGFAVPDLRKSASFTELMKESCKTTGVAAIMLAFSGSGGLKCNVSLNGNDVLELSVPVPASASFVDKMYMS